MWPLCLNRRLGGLAIAIGSVTGMSAPVANCIYA
jgi:hypothetical protein